MAEYSSTPPSFPGVAYTAGTMDIGSARAAGISEAGKGIAEGVKTALDVASQNRSLDDTLLAMNQAKILSDDAYKAVAGKSLGAKQTLLGMYANEWIQQQAQQRAFERMGYQTNQQLQLSHAEMLDKRNFITGQYGPGGQIAAGVAPGKLIINPAATGTATGTTGTTQPGVPTAQPIRRAQLVTPAPATSQAPSGAPTPNWATLGPGTYQLKGIGEPWDLSKPMPPGAVVRQIQRKDGTLEDGIIGPDGIWHRRPIT